ncbi:MAG TPA: LysR family transcriptional regulator [Candidatus Limnocylindria bacterium]|jgi:DNA-binding transcriptional LysR family regulator|nr:LysR family transcriptional regulator [Candidatus Limnocylindria bacterium]
MIRQLQYLVALAREEHFARAAESCGVSQPTLSAALRQLEEDLGTAIVERGNRFRGFTPEGEVVLRWARRILADERSLKQDLDASRGLLSGRLRLGVIPSANAIVPRFTTSFASENPHVVIDETETTSAEILRDLAIFELDAAITYIDNEPLDRVRALPIAVERYVLVLPESSPLAQLEAVTWAQAATLPLCLLRSDMQNRRIFEGVFSSIGVTPSVRVEAYSMMAKLCYLESGYWASIMPQNLMYWLRGLRGMRVVPLVEPEIAKTVGLVIADRDPIPALIRAFWQHVERLGAQDAVFSGEPS